MTRLVASNGTMGSALLASDNCVTMKKRKRQSVAHRAAYT